MKVINKPTKGPENEEAGEEMKKETAVKKSNIAVRNSRRLINHLIG
jgi:hypothetical protein